VFLQWPVGKTQQAELNAVVNRDIDPGVADPVCEIHETMQGAVEQLAADWTEKNSGKSTPATTR
jgi:hypothetical protein